MDVETTLYASSEATGEKKQSMYFHFSTDIQIPVPVGALLTCAMATPGGFAAFIKKRINELFKAILDDYGEFLTTRASRYVLTDDIKGE